MPRRSRKTKEPEKKVSLNLHTALFFLFFFSILTLFLLAHVYLRFTIRDLRVETVRLQSQKEKMRALEKKLIWQIGKLKHGDRLHEFARRDLGLVDVSPGSVQELRVPRRLIAKYSTGGKNTGYEELRWAEESYPSGFKGKVGSFLEINRELTAREETLEAAWEKATNRKQKPESCLKNKN